MASKHGHGFRPTYNGSDRSAAEQFKSLGDFAREIETTVGFIAFFTYDFPAKNTVFQKFGWTGTRLLLNGVEVVSNAFKVRYGGVYRCIFQGTFLEDLVLQDVIFKFYVNGVALTDQVVITPTALLQNTFTCFTMYMQVDDASTIDVRVRVITPGVTDLFFFDCQLFLIGNRL